MSKTRTEEVDQVLSRILEGENADELLRSLSDVEKDLFYELLTAVKQEGDTSLIDQLWRVDYRKKPPNIAEFILDDYWLGQVTRPSDENSGIFPIWQKYLEADFDLDSRIHNLVVTGSLGSGKCLAPGTLIMRPDASFTKVEDLVEGDLIMGDDSTPRRVTGVTSGEDEMYEIVPLRPKRGPTFKCNGAHILCLKGQHGGVIELSVDDYLKTRRAPGGSRLREYKIYRAAFKDAPRPLRTGFKIVPLGRGKYHGFELDGNRRFVLEGYYVTHNTWCSGIIFLYRLAMAVLLRNPQNFLGLSKGSSIFYVVLSISKAVVEDTAFGDIKNFMEKSPFFVEECRFNPELKYRGMRIPLPNDVWLTAGSKGQHVIGRNTMGICLDEGNWRLEANPDLKAYKLYDEVRTRIKNRFQKVTGFLPAISILSSSARDESSFTEKVIKDIEGSRDEKTEKVYRVAAFEARRHLLKLKPRWFKVAYGLKSIDPMVLEGWYLEDGTPIEDAESPHEAAPSGCQVVKVPEDYLDAFRRNCKTALQSVCGISTGGSHLLFPSTVDVERCLEMAERDGVQNAARVEYLPISTEDQAEIWDFLDHRKFCATRFSQIVPLRHPEAKRFGHIDLATATQAGLAICHLVGNQRVDGLVKDGIVYSEHRLVVEYDFILAIVAGKTKPISLEKIQRFFMWLKQECGFIFGTVTADSFQSSMPLQMMASRGFETKVLSMDRTKAPYYAWRTGFEELRIRPCRCREMMSELEELIDLPAKIDHNPDGKKDVTDACAGAYHGAINYEQKSGSPSGSEPSIYTDATITQGMDDGPVMILPVESDTRRMPVFQA